jgi:hypothetical protein
MLGAILRDRMGRGSQPRLGDELGDLLLGVLEALMDESARYSTV